MYILATANEPESVRECFFFKHRQIDNNNIRDGLWRFVVPKVISSSNSCEYNACILHLHITRRLRASYVRNNRIANACAITVRRTANNDTTAKVSGRRATGAVLLDERSFACDSCFFFFNGRSRLLSVAKIPGNETVRKNRVRLFGRYLNMLIKRSYAHGLRFNDPVFVVKKKSSSDRHEKNHLTVIGLDGQGGGGRATSGHAWTAYHTPWPARCFPVFFSSYFRAHECTYDRRRVVYIRTSPTRLHAATPCRYRLVPNGRVHGYRSEIGPHYCHTGQC